MRTQKRGRAENAAEICLGPKKQQFEDLKPNFLYTISYISYFSPFHDEFILQYDGQKSENNFQFSHPIVKRH